jgi:glucose/arabinose dehydrogenase
MAQSVRAIGFRSVWSNWGESQAMADAARHGAGGGGGVKVVADGLDNPRGIGFGPDGALYVAESGSGGPGPENCIQSPRAAHPHASAAPAP